MCGIAGYYGDGSREILEKMTQSLSHRGPDDQGFFIDERIGLGHRRLSIIDISSAGHQPMSNEDQTIWLVFNGEIYNHKKLKSNLKHQHRFKSRTDTEVIIHLYEEFGLDFLNQANGMFALALYDRNSKKLILARDRLGKKPLYWGKFADNLAFGSELKALFQHPVVKKDLDLYSLNKYLLYEYIPTPNSILKNIKKVEPGSMLIFTGGKIESKKFWNINFSKSQIESEHVKKELGQRIEQAVKMRLESDVPLGIFLSGGIDSTTIAYYAQKTSLQKIKTFSIGFADKSFDESSFARQAAEYLQTEHYEQILTPETSLELIPQLSDLLDEPLADGSIVPTFLLSKFTKQKVTVALSGDGGDELFCGYDPFVAHQLARYYEKIPNFIRHAIAKAVKFLPVSNDNISLDFKLKKFSQGLVKNKLHRNQLWLGSFDFQDRSSLFQKDIWQELQNANEFIEIDDYRKELNDENFYHQLIYIYLKTYLMDDILVKVDRASMYNSLEVRAPFLDFELVDYINSIPTKLKLKNFKTKVILKELMKDKLPAEIVFRKKKGFGMPIAKWLKKELKPWCLDLLSPEKIQRQGLFNSQYIERLLQEHFENEKDNRKLIWTLLIFQMWYDKWYR